MVLCRRMIARLFSTKALMVGESNEPYECLNTLVVRSTQLLQSAKTETPRAAGSSEFRNTDSGLVVSAGRLT